MWRGRTLLGIKEGQAEGEESGEEEEEEEVLDDVLYTYVYKSPSASRSITPIDYRCIICSI
jgi:hypothetical protein